MIIEHDGWFYSNTTNDIVQLVKLAHKEKKHIRVKGSGHSVIEAIREPKITDIIGIILSGELRSISMIRETVEMGERVAYVRVGAGCYIGHSPKDRLGTWDKSLNKWLDDRDYALPIMGGLAHQSLSGFLLTGSAGGSLTHGIADIIEEIELIDGLGNKRIYSRSDDEFYGVCVSMGLMGIIVYITLRVTSSYIVDGVEENIPIEASWLSKTERYKLPERFRETEYLHLNWFPQKKVNRVMQWRGERATSPKEIIPYHNIIGKKWQALKASAALFCASTALAINSKSKITDTIIGIMLRPFLPITSTYFCDNWWRALPADDYVPVDTLIKTDFTEVWIPIIHSEKVINILEQMFTDSKAAGAFAVEIYSAKSSPYWLSPAYNTDVIRIDPYWWAHGFGSIRRFFSYYWEHLLDIEGARLHWGKYLPEVGQKCGSTIFNASYLRLVYPKMNDWMTLRDQLDPMQIFTTSYWRRILDIKELS